MGLDLVDVLYDVHEHVATITMNRPDRLNALGGRLSQDLETAFGAARRDDDVRVIVLTGAGRGFCAGLDMKENSLGPGRSAGPRIPRYRGSELAREIMRIDKPIVGVINGAAVGWGFELALLCDMRIVSSQARMGDIHVARGLVQDNGGNFVLPRLVGWARACEILLTGDLFGAADCLRLGLANRVVPHDDLAAASAELARKLGAQAPLAVQQTKRLMREAERVELDDSLDHSMLVMWSLFETEDVKEAFGAFGEKRTPRFVGR